MFSDIVISCKGASKDIKKIAAFLATKLDEEIVCDRKSIQIAESYGLNSFEELENLAVESVIAFPAVPFKLTATGDEKDYLLQVQITYDGSLVKACSSDYYRIVNLADTIVTYEDYQGSGIKLKLTAKAFDEIKAGRSHIYNLRPDAQKPKLSTKIPMNEERIIYPIKRIILKPVNSIGKITTLCNQDQWGATITAEMMIEIDGEPIYLLARHYDTMKTLQFFATSDSVRFFWEKEVKTDAERRSYEKIMATAIEEYDNCFDSIFPYNGVFKLQLAALQNAIQEKANELGTLVTASWEIAECTPDL